MSSDRETNLAYLNDLLKVLAKQGRSVVLTQGSSPPRLETIAGADDRAWIKARSIDHKKLSSEFLIGVLINLAKYPRPDDPAISTTLNAKLLDDPDANAPKDVSFKLTKVTTASGLRKLKIEPS